MNIWEKEEIKELIKEYIKENLSLSVKEKTSIDDGEKYIVITLKIGYDVISEETFYTE